MSIEYLNIKEVPNDKAKDYFMRKIGKEFLLGETPSKEEFAAYTNSFSEKWALGAFEMSKYLIEASVSQVGEDLEKYLLFVQVVGYLVSGGSPLQSKTQDAAEFASFLVKFYSKNNTHGLKIDSTLSVKILSYIFSALPSSSLARPGIFYGLIDLVVDLGKKFLLTPYISKVEQILPWSLMSLEAKVEAYQHLFKLVKSDEENPLLYTHTIQFLKIFGDVSKEEILKHKSAISSSIIDIIKNNEYLFEIGELAQLKQIQAVTEDNTNLKHLLEAIVGGKIPDCQSIYTNNEVLLKAAGITLEDLKDKLRLTKITSLAVKHENLSFEQLSQELGCDQSEVEFLFISSIEHGFIDALIDQNSQSVYFIRVHKKNLDTSEIDLLPEKLKNLISTFEKFNLESN